MLTINDTEVVGWYAAIRGMRNPLNSWDRSDSAIDFDDYLKIGPNDLKLMQNLAKAGTDHRKFLRMITVYVDITAPLYWWKEFDTYKVGTVANSCSTMHTIQNEKFSINDFSHDHLENCSRPESNTNGYYICPNGETLWLRNLFNIIKSLNVARELYLDTGDKKYWWQMIQLLPSSYNQKRTVMMNYEVLANIYKSRKNHKLDEWVQFCEWIEELPYFRDIFEIELPRPVQEG